MKNVEVVKLYDLETESEAIAYVRAIKDIIGLALSIQEDGDIEIFLNTEDCLRLIASLQQAIEIASQDRG